MKKTLAFFSFFIIGLAIIFSSKQVNAQGFVFPSLPPIPTLPPMPTLPPFPELPNIFVCGKESFGSVRCNAKVVTDQKGNVKNNVAPSGYGPAQLRGAYGLTGTANGNPTIAIVDAYGDSNIQSDLNSYSSTFGLPVLPTCKGSVSSSSVACFQKVDQNGGTRYPFTNSGWALETALDVEMAHAICQNCKILLVEAASSSYNNLMTAVDRARLMGANVISNSYGSSEFSSETSYDSHFNYPGIAITFSSGDSGYGVEYPAASKYITAVGGTSLHINSDNSYNSETVWSGTGSGCSSYEGKPSWQVDPSCPRRTVADVSADADPSTGAAVYDSVNYAGVRGWFQVGGTSLASPIIAGTYALSGNYGEGLSYNSAVTGYLHDVISGSNGSCGGSYLCTALPGYDGPTGLGSPQGTGAF
ncbi:MAG: S53 family peptidase [Candidatus Microgenomates bacterium]